MMQTSVLVVEDEGVVAEDIRQTLVDAGYDAFAIAMSGDEAIARAAERCPDIVLMDIRIRGPRDGIETARILRERFDVPVVFLTAYADAATVERAKQTAPFGYLTKPIRTPELCSSLEVSLFRHAMEKRARARERWFATTLRSIGDAVIAVDLAGRVTFMNHVAETLTGVEAEQALGRPAREIVQLTDPKLPASPLDAVLADGKTRDIPVTELRHATGESRLISDVASPVIDEGEMLGAVMVFRDVTEETRLHERLELADRLASLGTMAAGVAHEINNPLAVVMANASYVREVLGDWLANDLRRREVGDVLADIESAAGRIARIVSDLQTFARPPATHASSGHVEPALAWAVRTTAHELRSRATLVNAIDSALPPVALDEPRLSQVLVNLLVNAAHAIEPGRVDAMYVRVSGRRDGSTVVIEVRDNGPGMPSEVVKRVFEPFFTTKPIGVGTGLGLAICHGIVASVGGTIVADSELGAGTTFRITLPVAAPSGADGAPSEVSTKQRGRILAIDDEPMVLQGMKRVLRDHDVTCVADATTALALLASGERFDLILTDMMMPRMTGMELYEQILATYPEMVRLIVFITGGTASARVHAFLASVPNACLEKPINNSALQAFVQQRLAGA